MKVSIIIPIYNVSAYIERCIKSVMSQTYNGEIECILVNDASPDDSIDIAERLIADYNGPIQFRILNHEHNRGLSAARNTGIDAATGDYLYFFDSDDEITPNCIEKLSRPVLKDPTIEMVEGCYTVIWDDSNNGKAECPMPKPQKDLTTRKAVRDFYFSKQAHNKYAWNKLVKRTFLLKNLLYFKEGFLGEDYFWHFQYFKYLSHLYIIPDITYKYCRRPNSITTKPNQDIRAGIGLRYAEIAKNLSPTEGSQEVKYFLKGFCLLYINGPTTPIYKQVAIQFLKVLKDNHCFKECFFLKTIVFVSKFSIIKNFIKKLGVFLKSVSKNKDENNFKM